MVDTSVNSMNAYIINGTPDGTVNSDRWETALSQCEALGLKCIRSPSVFVKDNKEYAAECSNYDQGQSTSLENFERGCMYAHKKVLKTIVDAQDDRAIVFEDDISIPANADVARSIVQDELQQHRDADILYLGNCFDGLCTHAMAISKRGAEQILEKVDWCHRNWPIDHQLRHLCDTKQLNCSYTASYPHEFKYDAWADGVIKQQTGTTLQNSDFVKAAE